MAATYPSSVVTFSTKVDNVTTVYAADPNTIQDEVRAIEQYLGTNPHISGSMASGSYTATPNTTFDTVSDRIANVEAGLYKAVSTSYVTKVGGDTITASSASVKGLQIKGATSQTANLQEWQLPNGTTGAYVDKDANLIDPKIAADINNLYVLNVVFG